MIIMIIQIIILLALESKPTVTRNTKEKSNEESGCRGVQKEKKQTNKKVITACKGVRSTQINEYSDSESQHCLAA